MSVAMLDIDLDDQVKNLTLSSLRKNVKLDFESFWPDDFECLWIGYLMDGCPTIDCAMARENLSDKFKSRREHDE